MIKAIRIRNYQSHKETDIHFTPGVNVIVGSSNNGKTAILRAFDWVFRNKPLGLDFVSYWNRDKNGNPKTATSVVVEVDGDREAMRVRDKEFNGYRLYKGGSLIKELEATKTEVPEEILSLLNLSDVNIQRQLDSHFLLSSTSGEVARFFNKIIRLDLIDRVLSAAESKRRDIAQDIKSTKKSKEEYEKKLAGFDWMDDAERLLNKANRVEDRIEANELLLNKINRKIEAAEDAQGIIQELNFIPLAEQILAKIEQINAHISEKEKSQKRLNSLIAEYQTQQEILDGIPDLEVPLAKIAEIDKISESIQTKQKEGAKIADLLRSYQGHQTTIKESDPEIQKLERQLPTTCPLCGSPLKEGVFCGTREETTA